MFKGLGGIGDMAKMMKSAQDMQKRMADLQEEMARMEVTGESGAGLVKATASVQGELKALTIDPSIFDPAEREVVEDLILAAIKDAQSRAQAKMQEEMGRIGQELGLPPGMGFPG